MRNERFTRIILARRCSISHNGESRESENWVTMKPVEQGPRKKKNFEIDPARFA